MTSGGKHTGGAVFAMPWPAIGLIVAAVVIAYANSFAGVFLYDDFDSITLNPHIRQLWPLSEAMSRPLADAAETVSTRPILSLTLALNLALLGPEPGGFHAVNLVIHCAAALLLLGLVRRGAARCSMSAQSATAFAGVAALLWAVHPLCTSSVTYIVQRAESLGGALLLATLYAAVRAFDARTAVGRRRWYAASVAAAALGMATKETVAAAPLLVLAWDATFVSPSWAGALRRRRGLYAALASTWLILLPLLSSDTGELARPDRALAYALTQPGVIVHYLSLSLWPHPLVMSYEWPYAASWREALVPGLAIAAAAGATLIGLLRRRWYGVAGAAFFVVLAPSSSVFDLTQRAMEHRMYLPLASVVVVLVAGANRLLTLAIPAASARHAVAATATVVVTLALAATTVARNAEYADEVGFWRSNVEHRPDNYIAWLQLGRAQVKTGAYRDAERSLTRAVEVGPPFGPVHNELGRALIAQGKLREAERELGRAIEIDPADALAHNNLGIVFERRGDAARAAEQFRRALDLAPGLSIARENLARVTAAAQ